MDHHMSTSGCESGWTVYLDESYSPRNNNYSVHSPNYTLNSAQFGVGEEVDLSMVSDASSGPPHFRQDDQECYNRMQNLGYPTSLKSVQKSEKKSKKSSGKEQRLRKHQSHNHGYSSVQLDDTASSPDMTYSQQVHDNPSIDQASIDQFLVPQGYSTSQFQDSSYNNPYAYWESSHPKDSHTGEPSHYTGQRWL